MVFSKTTVNKEAINRLTLLRTLLLFDCHTKMNLTTDIFAGAVNIPLDKITEDRILRRFPDKKLLSISSAVIISDRKKRSKPLKFNYKNAIFGGNMEEHYEC